MADAVKKPASAALALAATIALVTSLVVSPLKSDEGRAPVGYLDIARIPTDCFGHTGSDVVIGRAKTDTQCDAELAGDVRVHLNGVLRCSPALAGHPYQLAAATRLTFNIGVGAFCSSTVARRFNAGDLRGGCDAFLAWNKARIRGVSTVVRGLADRRARERAMCLTGLA